VLKNSRYLVRSLRNAGRDELRLVLNILTLSQCSVEKSAAVICAYVTVILGVPLPLETKESLQADRSQGDGRGTSQRREQFPAFVEGEQRSCKYRPQHLMCVSPSFDVSTLLTLPPTPQTDSSRKKSLQIISFPIIGCKVLKHRPIFKSSSQSIAMYH
jgi:hypothetical protein